MIQVETQNLRSALEETVSRARLSQTSQLVSFTEPIDSFDPYLFFENGNQLEGDRVFWSSPEEKFYLAGAGEAFSITSADNRFGEMEKQWKHLLAHASIYNPYEMPGTGPIALGGFSFDPEKETSGLWKKFEGSQFRIPAYLLTVRGDASYLTINCLVGKAENAAQLEESMEKSKQLLLNKAPQLPAGPKIMARKDIEPEYWKETVKKATDSIQSGEAEKIVLAREMRVEFEEEASLASVLRNLSNAQKTSYIFAFEQEGNCFLGASPERLVKVEDRKLLSTCLAGTARRGFTQREDEMIGKKLLYDKKNRQEHDFVVQMIKQAVEGCSRHINVPEVPALLKLKHLQHLYTPVEARLDDAYTIIDVVKRLHPTPALGGLPKQNSLAFIREHEKLDRGWYGAPVGWMDAYENGEFAVAIRSSLVQGKEASLFAGCGIVQDSDPEAEYEETLIKLAPMLSVLGG